MIFWNGVISAQEHTETLFYPFNGKNHKIETNKLFHSFSFRLSLILVLWKWLMKSIWKRQKTESNINVSVNAIPIQDCTTERYCQSSEEILLTCPRKYCNTNTANTATVKYCQRSGEIFRACPWKYWNIFSPFLEEIPSWMRF